jgi:hypothetical protein
LPRGTEGATRGVDRTDEAAALRHGRSPTAFINKLHGAARAWGAGREATSAIIFISGASFTFHLALTFMFLRTDQTDINEQGAVFSYPLIYLFNIVFAAFLVDLYLARDMDYLAFVSGGIMDSAGMVTMLANKAYGLMR